MGRLFGTDGARGIANTEISCGLAANIGRAAAMIIEEKKGSRPLFLIGKDTRISGDMLDCAITAGLCSAGADVVRIGVVPTPAVAYLVQRMGADAGVMISASHNPAEFNGIKLFGSDGLKLTDEEEYEIESIVLDKAIPYTVKWGAHVGRVSEDHQAVGRYIDHVAGTLVLDCANGSASATAKTLFERLGADCTILHSSPNGVNINENCGSTHLGRLAQAVRAGGYDAGLAFDGDADRCLAVDETGGKVSGDQMIAVLAQWFKQQGKLKNNAVVVTVMSNFGFFEFARKQGITAETTKVGDRYVLERMLEQGHCLGGEQSGHIIFLENATTGDGQLTAVQLLSILKQSGRPLSELVGVMTQYPQVLVNLRADTYMKCNWELDEGVAKCISRCNEQLAGNGRILVRASGTEPLIRIMVEGKCQQQIEAMAQQIADTIQDRLEKK